MATASMVRVEDLEGLWPVLSDRFEIGPRPEQAAEDCPPLD